MQEKFDSAFSFAGTSLGSGELILTFKQQVINDWHAQVRFDDPAAPVSKLRVGETLHIVQNGSTKVCTIVNVGRDQVKVHCLAAEWLNGSQ